MTEMLIVLWRNNFTYVPDSLNPIPQEHVCCLQYFLDVILRSLLTFLGLSFSRETKNDKTANASSFTRATDRCIVDIPKFNGNLFSMVVKYHVITLANLVARTQFSDLSQRACVYFRLRAFEEKKKHIIFAFVCPSMPEGETLSERRK